MCQICNYNQVQDIDRALLAGTTPEALSKLYKSFSPAMLARHYEHLREKMALAQKRFHSHLHQGLFCRLNLVLEMVLQIIRRTKGSEDPKIFLQASREFTRIVTLMEKMAAKGRFDPEFIYCLLANYQWDLQEDALLPNAFPAMSQSRQTMKQNLFAPCPEPEPEPLPASDTSMAIHSSNLETLPADQVPEPLPEISTNLVRLHTHEPEPAKVRSAPHSGN
jgi:hypothetical protein